MYIDPGTGSVLLQVVLATVLGLGVFFKVFWRKISAALNKNKGTVTEDNLIDQKKGENL
jgi:hypothetical protein